jgi:hypothetical protein
MRQLNRRVNVLSLISLISPYCSVNMAVHTLPKPGDDAAMFGNTHLACSVYSTSTDRTCYFEPKANFISEVTGCTTTVKHAGLKSLVHFRDSLLYAMRQAGDRELAPNSPQARTSYS